MRQRSPTPVSSCKVQEKAMHRTGSRMAPIATASENGQGWADGGVSVIQVYAFSSTMLHLLVGRGAAALAMAQRKVRTPKNFWAAARKGHQAS